MKPKQSNRAEMIFLYGLILFLMPTLLSAQEYPTKPVGVLVAYSPGGGYDITFRPLASKAQKFLGQSFVISNNGGGGGSVGAGIVAKQKPDGYHLLGAGSLVLVSIPLVREVAYSVEDFVPIIYYGTAEGGIAVRADAPYKSLKEFVEYAKKNPGKVSYSLGGVDSPYHLIMEYIAKKEGIQWTVIPFEGGARALTALLGGNVTATAGSTTSWFPHVNAGSLRILATYGKERLKTFPNIPRLSDLGYNVSWDEMRLVSAPKGVSASVIKKLEDAFRKALADPELIKVMETMDLNVMYGDSKAAKDYLGEARIILEKIVKEVRIPKK